MIADNISFIKKRIHEALLRSGNNPESVRLVCVTKEATLDEMKRIIDCGEREIGENRVVEAYRKKTVLDAYAGGIVWHIIGHIQTNKVKRAVQMAHLIHSLESVKTASLINEEAKKLKKKQRVLIEVNVAEEQSKFGIGTNELVSFIREINGLANIQLCGLMTMAPYSDDPEDSRPFYRKLKKVFEDLRSSEKGCGTLSELSMGMSQDFEVAVEEGATLVRVGRKIFDAPFA